MQKVQCHKTTAGPSVYCLYLLFPPTSVRNESFSSVFFSPLHIKTQTTQTPWQDNFLCLPPFSHSSVVNNFRIHFYVLGPNTFLGKKLTSLPSWIYSSIRLYALNMKSSSSTHRGLIITRSAGWPKKTCRIIAKHFLLPFRISLRHPRVFCLLTAIAIAPHPAQYFRRGTPLIRVPHTFGLFPVPGAVLPFFYVYVAKSAEFVSCGKATFCPFLLLYFFSGAEV